MHTFSVKCEFCYARGTACANPKHEASLQTWSVAHLDVSALQLIQRYTPYAETRALVAAELATRV